MSHDAAYPADGLWMESQFLRRLACHHLKQDEDGAARDDRRPFSDVALLRKVCLNTALSFSLSLSLSLFACLSC